MNNKNPITPYDDINAIVLYISQGLQAILNQNLIGFYLLGSLTYGDFNPDSSDIDLVAIINRSLAHDQLNLIRKLHKQVEEEYPTWSHRLECSYTPIDFFKSTLPPSEPRPYYGEGVFYDEAPYGNEWIINNYLLYHNGILLLGRYFKELIAPIDIVDVQTACIKDLFQEWEPKVTDLTWLNNSHYQSYFVLNLCRILYTIFCNKAGTKKEAARWVKSEFGSQWINLIETAESWEYGKKMAMRNEAIHFIKFVIDKVKQTAIYKKIY